MTSTSSLPTVILVHGAWHTPPAYQTYIDGLQKVGFIVHCPHLPSCKGGELPSLPSSPPLPSPSLREDVAAVRALVTSLVEEKGERVLLIMHSYGGVVGTDAVSSSEEEASPLHFSARQAAGLKGGVVHLLYLCAYILEPGRSVWDLVVEAGMAPLWDQLIDTDPVDGSIFPLDPGLAFFSKAKGEMKEEEHEAMMRHLVHFPMSAVQTPVQQHALPAWKYIPTTYVYTQNDFSVPRTFQDLMTKRVREQHGVSLRTEDYDTHHSIWVSHLDDMVRVALEAARYGREGK